MMRKYYSGAAAALTAAVLTAAMLMTGCGGSAAPASSAAQTTAAETTVAQTTAAQTTAAETTVAQTTAAQTTAAETTEAQTTAAQAAEAGKSAEEIYEDAAAAAGLSDMTMMNENYIMNNCGIDLGTVRSYVFALPNEATKVDPTVIIFEAADADTAAGISAQLESIRTMTEQTMNSYAPDQGAIAAAGQVRTAGNYVYLVMSGNADVIESAISADIQ